ncbi:thioredoxin family protein [Rossellomorea aquimaris]|uniref:thioredoxin family protein n=1 Tax=Rossellomorea aquimaris TaxID=189382 RepID=UPI001CD6C44B|nr:thioredoxin family protein [Rossellomorea aquimaris]MCA1055515.1 thioredoxin family protein [Rossellomorea aquimaris]
MNEVSSARELVDSINSHEHTAVYLYTPMCGTCQVAGKMIEVVQRLPQTFHFEKVNLNYLPEFAESQEIESVPCLLLYKNAEELERVYAFQSVPYLYELLKKTEAFSE